MGVNEQAWRETVTGRRVGPWAALTRGALRTLAEPYGLAVSLRRRLYARGTLRTQRAAVPVISVGNVTVGGTGKTPLTAWIVRQLQAMGRRPAILTRGYRAAAGLADEAELLGRLCASEVRPAVPIIVRADRVAGAAEAVARGANVCVLDDGFQHLRLHRDLDVVAIDATEPFGQEAVVPRGLLREPLTALRCAGVIVLTRCDQVSPDRRSAIRERLGLLTPQAPVAESIMQPTTVCEADGSAQPAQSLTGRTVWAFCGLGNPDGFYATLEALGAKLLGKTSFNDHHAYTGSDLERLAESSSQAGAEMLLTTAKDAVKLRSLRQAKTVKWLDVELAVQNGEAALAEALRTACRDD